MPTAASGRRQLAGSAPATGNQVVQLGPAGDVEVLAHQALSLSADLLNGAGVFGSAGSIQLPLQGLDGEARHLRIVLALFDKPSPHTGLCAIVRFIRGKPGEVRLLTPYPGVRPRSSLTSVRYSESEYSALLRSAPQDPDSQDGMLAVQLPLRSTGYGLPPLTLGQHLPGHQAAFVTDATDATIRPLLVRTHADHENPIVLPDEFSMNSGNRSPSLAIH